jgi:hypothetical protein
MSFPGLLTKPVMLFILICIVNKCSSELLTNSYFIEFHNDVEKNAADEIAKRNDFVNIGPV